MTVRIASDDKSLTARSGVRRPLAEGVGCIFELRPTDPNAFERAIDAPEGQPFRLLVDDGHREYALPWPYLLRDGDFFAIKTGRALHDSIAVRGWRLWEGEA